MLTGGGASTYRGQGSQALSHWWESASPTPQPKAGLEKVTPQSSSANSSPDSMARPPDPRTAAVLPARQKRQSRGQHPRSPTAVRAQEYGDCLMDLTRHFPRRRPQGPALPWPRGNRAKVKLCTPTCWEGTCPSPPQHCSRHWTPTGSLTRKLCRFRFSQPGVSDKANPRRGRRVRPATPVPATGDWGSLGTQRLGPGSPTVTGTQGFHEEHTQAGQTGGRFLPNL